MLYRLPYENILIRKFNQPVKMVSETDSALHSMKQNFSVVSGGGKQEKMQFSTKPTMCHCLGAGQRGEGAWGDWI